jgi:hypothetical protein
VGAIAGVTHLIAEIKNAGNTHALELPFLSSVRILSGKSAPILCKNGDKPS